MITKEEKPTVPTIEDYHYYLFNDDFNSKSTGDLIKFIIERNLMSKDKPKMMKLIINSPGGDLASAFAVIDLLKGSKIPVYTYGLGEIASSALMLFIAGKKGKRFITRNTSILSHQYSSISFGKDHELMARVKEFNNIQERMMEHYKICTGLTEKQIKTYLLPPEDVWLTAKEAVKYGIADEIVDHI